MSKQLYEEALADVKKIREVAENNAKHAILETLTPRIRELIEKEILKEHGEDVAEFGDDDMLLDAPLSTPPSADAAVPADAVTLPDEEGKVTLDLDALQAPEDEYVLNHESLEALAPVIEGTKFASMKELELETYRLGEAISKFKKAGKLVRESTGYREQIAQMISRVENMYEYVQGSIPDQAQKASFETKLESHFQELSKLSGPTMSNKLKNLIKEDEAVDAGAEAAGGELTLKLTGLPADVELDDIGVDLISGEEDAGSDDVDVDAAADAGDLEVDDGGDDLGDLDLGGDEGEEEEEPAMEATELSDDTVVEIDENMLRRELKRMKRLREEASIHTDANGNGVDSAQLEDFGGASEEGEPIHMDVTTESEEMLEMDEAEECSTDKMESRIRFEKRLQERAKSRARAIKAEVKKASGAKKSVLVKEFNRTVKRFNESVRRSRQLSQQLSEARKPRVEKRLNSASKRPAENGEVANLRKKLAESNLNNTKLALATKVLQRTDLSKVEKAAVIKRLDESRTVEAAKKAYTDAAKKTATLSEGRLLGSASRPTRSAGAATLNEGFETERWSRLAGITK